MTDGSFRNPLQERPLPDIDPEAKHGPRKRPEILAEAEGLYEAREKEWEQLFPKGEGPVKEEAPPAPFAGKMTRTEGSRKAPRKKKES